MFGSFLSMWNLFLYMYMHRNIILSFDVSKITYLIFNIFQTLSRYSFYTLGNLETSAPHGTLKKKIGKNISDAVCLITGLLKFTANWKVADKQMDEWVL